MFKKLVSSFVLLISAISLITTALLPLTTKAAAAKVYGYVEEAGADGHIKGWVYYNDAIVNLTVIYENINDPSDIRQYKISNQQSSNEISFFSDRKDVRAYIMANQTKPTFKYPQGFLMTGKYLPAGIWRLRSVSVDGVDNSNLTIKGTKGVIHVDKPNPYGEGYIDITDSRIEGWAYASDATDTDIAPALKFKFSRTDGSDTKEFSVARGAMKAGPIQRVLRNDVVQFLGKQRGQDQSSFNLNRGYAGFKFNLSAAPGLTEGAWKIIAISADGYTLPYGNNKLSSIVIVPAGANVVPTPTPTPLPTVTPTPSATPTPTPTGA